MTAVDRCLRLLEAFSNIGSAVPGGVPLPHPTMAERQAAMEALDAAEYYQPAQEEKP